MSAITDTLPPTVTSPSSGGLLPPSLSASNFASPSSTFLNKEKTRRESVGEATTSPTAPSFDPTKAFGERRGSRTASTGSGSGDVGAREELKKEAKGKGMGSVEEENDAPAKWTPPPIVQKSTPSHALTPGLDSIPFSDSFAAATEKATTGAVGGEVLGEEKEGKVAGA